jgi:ABC-type transport system involved in cytochrome bd biosynthesis fused ATPase/permease subunit
MTSFVHLEYSNQHPGVARVESAIASAQQIKRNFSTAKSLAMLLLSAMAAAVMVVAYQVMDSMAEGHLLALWIGLWVAAFATLAAFASTARYAVVSAKASLDSWSRKVAAKRADERLWAMAKTDARLMADLQAVRTRNDAGDEGLRFVPPVVVKNDWLVSSASRYGSPVPFV